MKRCKLLSALLSICLFGLVAIVEAAPPIPATYWGYATVNGNPYPDGTLVEALIDDTVFATTTVFTYEGDAGLYLVDVPGDDPDSADVVEGGQTGDAITFRVNSIVAQETILWRSGDYVQHDLTTPDQPPSAVTLTQHTAHSVDGSILLILTAVALIIGGTIGVLKHSSLHKGKRFMKIKPLFLLAILLGWGTQLVQAAPPIPHGSWGQVSADGVLYPDGTEVKAIVNGIEFTTTTFTYGNDASLYDINIAGDDPDTTGVVEGGTAGDTITFVVAGVAANETAVWTSGVYDNLALTLPVANPPSADFSATPVTGIAPFTTSFADASTGNITSWAWDFGDGNSSHSQNPSHTYAEVGSYSVSLTVAGPDGNDVETKTAYITVTNSEGAPALTVAEVTALPNRTVDVPITFASNGHAITSLIFSLDIDSACLNFDENDGDGNGIPDGVTLSVPAGFSASAQFDSADVDGELDFFISDVTLPFASLADGVIATLHLQATCQPASGTSQVAAINFATDPPVSFGDDAGQSVAGLTHDGRVTILAGNPGDCNADQRVDAGDISALSLEIFDNDGNLAVDTLSGTFAGDPVGCDANEDDRVDAGDVACAVLIIFNGEGACTTGARTANDNPAEMPFVALPSDVEAPSGTAVTLPLAFHSSGNTISSLVLSVDLDDRLIFDPQDGNNDGIPDAVTFSVPASFSTSATYDSTDLDGELDIFIADIIQPIESTLLDGIVATIEVTVPHDVISGEQMGIGFSADPTVSFGNTAGQSVAGYSEDGAITIVQTPTAITGLSTQLVAGQNRPITISMMVTAMLFSTAFVVMRKRTRNR